MAYSSGFNPHPRISYAGAAPTGSASEAEYLEIALARVVEPATVHAALAESLPTGLDVVAVVTSPGGALADRLQASHWQVDIDSAVEESARAVQAFIALNSSMVERMTKRGLRSFDCRAAVLSLRAEPGTRGTALDLVLRHSVPAVRPDDVLAGLTADAGLVLEGAALLTRLAQGPLDETTLRIGDPLTAS